MFIQTKFFNQFVTTGFSFSNYKSCKATLVGSSVGLLENKKAPYLGTKAYKARLSIKQIMGSKYSKSSMRFFPSKGFRLSYFFNSSVVVKSLNPYGIDIPNEHVLVSDFSKSIDVPLIPLEDRGILDIKVGIAPNPRPKGHKSRMMGYLWQVFLPDLNKMLQQALINNNNKTNLPSNSLVIGNYTQTVTGFLNNEPFTFEMPALHSPNDAIYARTFLGVAVKLFVEQKRQSTENRPAINLAEISQFTNSTPSVDPEALTGIAIIGDTQNIFNRNFSNRAGSITINKGINDTKLLRGIDAHTIKTAKVVPAVPTAAYDPVNQTGQGYALLKTLPITLTAVLYPSLVLSAFKTDPAELLSGTDILRVNSTTLQTEENAAGPINMTIFVNYDTNTYVPLSFDTIEAFYGWIDTERTWQLLNLTPRQPLKTPEAQAVTVPELPVNSTVNLGRNRSTTRPNVETVRLRDWSTFSPTDNRTVTSNSFVFVNLTVETVDTKVAFGLTTSTGIVLNQYLFWQIFADGTYFSRVYMHPVFLVACLNEQLLSSIRLLHSKSIRYEYFEVRSYAQKTWIEEQADVSGTTLLSGGHGKYYGNLDSTGLYELVNTVNMSEQLIFTPIFQSDRTESTASRYIPLSIIESSADISEKKLEIGNVLNKIGSPLFLINSSVNFTTPIILLNPCYKRGKYYRLSTNLTFKGLVSNSTRGTDDED